MIEFKNISEIDTAFGNISITLDYDPAFIYLLKRYEKGKDLSIATLEASSKYLSVVRKDIIENYLSAKKPRAETGENKLVNRTGGMKKSLMVRKNIESDLNKSYAALMVGSSAINRRTGVRYPLALETGWRGRTKMKSADYNTNVFIPPFFYTQDSFTKNIDKFGKYLLRNINSTTQKIFFEYMQGKL